MTVIGLHDFLDKHDPRPFRACPYCFDIGMIQGSNGDEDVCPQCEGSIWRDRVPWASWIERQRILGYRVTLPRRQFPNRKFRIWKDWPA